MKISRLSGIKGGTGVTLETSADFMRYKANNGFLLGLIADEILAEIQKLADLGLGSDGVPFAKYKPRVGLETENGKLKRNAKGQWIEKYRIESNRPVTLRSLDEVPDGKRMRENIKRYPVIVNKDTKRTTLQTSGGRRDEDGGSMRSYSARLKAAQGLDPSTAAPIRDLLSIHSSLAERVLAKVAMGGVLGFITKENERHNAREVAKAIRIQKRLQKQTEREERARERAARAAHREEIRKAKAGKPKGNT